MNTEEKPIVVNASPAGLQAGTLARDVTLVLAALPALVAVLGRRDLVEIVNYLGSAEFAPAAGVIVTAAVLVWRQLLARRAKATQLTLAQAEPGQVKIVGEK